MAKEIERKFLVDNAEVVADHEGKSYRQGYINTDGVEVRVRMVGDKGSLTIKGEAKGAARDEYEYSIPIADAQEMLRNLCGDRIVDKIRYVISAGQHVFEVDIFSGKNKGLILAEVELSSEDEAVVLPDWLGREVTGDKRYSNASLARTPLDDS